MFHRGRIKRLELIEWPLRSEDLISMLGNLKNRFYVHRAKYLQDLIDAIDRKDTLKMIQNSFNGVYHWSWSNCKGGAIRTTFVEYLLIFIH